MPMPSTEVEHPLSFAVSVFLLLLTASAECLKWDDTLWSHADHFRVRGRQRLMAQAAVEGFSSCSIITNSSS